MNKLDLSTCTTNLEVLNKIREHVDTFKINEVIHALSDKFIHHETAVRNIIASLLTGNGAILYGPGGYGKSEIVLATLEYLGIPVTFKICYKGMTSEELIGLPNMKKLMQDSIYEISFENSVFAIPSVLVLEELFDADPSTVVVLKDILTAKGFREKENKKESLVGAVIILGNKDPKDISEDNDSFKAFFEERFPYKHKMLWATHNKNDYLELFKRKFKNLYQTNKDTLVIISELCANNNTRVSPRKAIYIVETVIHLGLNNLDILEDLDTSNIEEIKYRISKEKTLEEEINFLNKYFNLGKNITDEFSKAETIEDKHIVILKLERLEEKFKENLEQFNISAENLNLLQEVTTFFKISSNFLKDELFLINEKYSEIEENLNNELNK